MIFIAPQANETCVQCVRHSDLIQDILQTTSPFTDPVSDVDSVVVSATQHDRLLEQINGVCVCVRACVRVCVCGKVS